MTLYQYLLVYGIGKMVDGFVNPSDMMQVVDDQTLNPLTDTGMGEKPSSIEKAKSYLLGHYDSSNLRYLRALPEEAQPAQISRRYATYLWWQGATRSLKRKQAGKQEMRGQLQVLVSLYIPTTKLCISMLFCRPVPEGDAINWVSTYDAAEPCFGTPHIVATIAALAVLGCFTMGFPAFIYFKMAALRDPSGGWKPGRFTSLVRLSYVFKEDRRAWQAVVMIRQVWLVGAKVLADLLASPENQTLPFAAFNGASRQLRVWAWPWRPAPCDSPFALWRSCRRAGLALGAICGDTDIGALAGGVPPLRACARQRAGAVVSACSAVRHMCVHVRAPASHEPLQWERVPCCQSDGVLPADATTCAWSGQGLTLRSPQTRP